MLRACLGIYPDAPRKTLKIVNPHLPKPLERVRLERLRIGDTRVSVEFTCTGDSCFAAVREMEGEPLAIRIELGAHRDEA